MWAIETMVQAIYSKFHNEEKCMLATFGSNLNGGIYSLPLQKVIFTTDYVEMNNESTSTKLQQSTSCLVAIVDDASYVQDIAYVTRKVWQQEIVKVGGKKPSIQDLSKVKYSIIWLDSKSRDQVYFLE